MDIDDEPALSSDVQEFHQTKETRKNFCPKCKEEMEVITLGSRTLFVCECGFKTSRRTE